MGVAFPIYAAEDWPAQINGQGSSGDDLTSLTIADAETLPDAVFVQHPRLEGHDLKHRAERRSGCPPARAEARGTVRSLPARLRAEDRSARGKRKSAPPQRHAGFGYRRQSQETWILSEPGTVWKDETGSSSGASRIGASLCESTLASSDELCGNGRFAIASAGDWPGRSRVPRVVMGRVGARRVIMALRLRAVIT
ncbi:MAG TPA: hypothetical protein VFP55_06270, partial [Solirubrobacteraceae bacterium]|nr:hypothetical protein [Solirubrobacteraceae bacterium]